MMEWMSIVYYVLLWSLVSAEGGCQNVNVMSAELVADVGRCGLPDVHDVITIVIVIFCPSSTGPTACGSCDMVQSIFSLSFVHMDEA